MTHATQVTQCSVVSADAAEPLDATASPVRRWLLIERPGAWGRDAVAMALADVLPPASAATLLATWAAGGVRPLLVRRPGRHPRTRGAHSSMMWGNPQTGHMSVLPITDLADLAAVMDVQGVAALDALAAGSDLLDAPVLLVCTHGTKDLCCATAGRPLAAALAQKCPTQTWECSHVGGDRFAGNLVVAPWGEYHGRVDPETAVAIAAAAATGRVRLENYRGRATYDAWQQAAEIAVRRATGLLQRADVTCRAAVLRADAAAHVTVDTPLGAFDVSVVRARGSAQQASHCRGPLVPVTHVAEAVVGPLPGEKR